MSEKERDQIFAAVDVLTTHIRGALDAANTVAKTALMFWLESLKATASSQNNASSSQSCDRLMTSDEVAEYVGLTRETIYAWAKDNNIPHLKLNGELRFRRYMLDAWMEPNKDKIETARKKARRCDKVKPLFPAANR